MARYRIEWRHLDPRIKNHRVGVGGDPRPKGIISTRDADPASRSCDEHVELLDGAGGACQRGQQDVDGV